MNYNLVVIKKRGEVIIKVALPISPQKKKGLILVVLCLV
jgi:hypothetical protein